MLPAYEISVSHKKPSTLTTLISQRRFVLLLLQGKRKWTGMEVDNKNFYEEDEISENLALCNRT